MGLIGAMAGAAIGSRTGALGAILGAIAGNWLESKFEPFVAKAARKCRDAAPPGMFVRDEAVFLAAIGAMFAKIAKADGCVTEDEIACTERLFGRLGIRGRRRELCIDAFRRARDSRVSIYRYAVDYAAAQPDFSVRAILYTALWDLACADGVVTEAEDEMLRRVIVNLGLPRIYYDHERARRLGSAGSRRERRSDPQADARAVLGVGPNADADEIKKAYREKAKSLHPDVLSAKGLPSGMVSRAAEELKRVNAAYAILKGKR